MTALDEARTWTTSPAKAARETDFYRSESPDLDPGVIPPLLGETLLGKLEGIARPLVDKLADTPDGFTDGDKEALSFFISMQFTRGVAHRQAMEFLTNEYFRITYGDLSDDGVRRLLKTETGDLVSEEQMATARQYIADIRSGELKFRPQQAASVSSALQFGRDLAPLLYERPWVVYETSRILVTTDEPVVPVGSPDGIRNQRAGLQTAGVVLFPLGPDRLLVMPHPTLAEVHLDAPPVGAAAGRRRLDQVETTQVSRELLAHAYRWGFERPSKSLALRLALPSQLERERVEDFGARKLEDDGTESQLMRWFSPNRWYGADEVPPLPVAWWWI